MRPRSWRIVRTIATSSPARTCSGITRCCRRHRSASRLEQSLATVAATRFLQPGRCLWSLCDDVWQLTLLPPFEYVEGFGVIQNRCLPDPRTPTPGADLFRDRTALGLHYHKNLMTPYWDAEGGYSLDVSYQFGLPIFGTEREFHQAYGQFAFVKGMSFVNDWLGDGHIANWLADTRWAFRVGGAAALPNSGQFFSLGGGDNFRGFDLAERQGSMLWIGSVEWRVPVLVNRQWDFVDHVGSVRNVYVAPFTTSAYLRQSATGTITRSRTRRCELVGIDRANDVCDSTAKTVNSVIRGNSGFGISIHSNAYPVPHAPRGNAHQTLRRRNINSVSDDVRGDLETSRAASVLDARASGLPRAGNEEIFLGIARHQNRRCVGRVPKRGGDAGG